jgi:hypothetical protein
VKHKGSNLQHGGQVNDQTSRYFDAAQYAVNALGDTAPRYFARLQQLSRNNSIDELKSIVDGWGYGFLKTRPIPAGLWAQGSAWGSAVRVGRDRGIFWKLKCACGKYFETSTNDTVDVARRKCSTCLFADELSQARQQIVARLESTSQIVLAWHRAHDNLIWNRVHKACRLRGITDPEFTKELHALCWAKISERAGGYRDEGFKPSAWLGRVADNCLKDFFKVTTNRERLAPTSCLISEDSREAAAPPTKPGEVLPAKKTVPRGASPHDKTLNPQQTAWDASQQDWNSSERA